MMRIKKLLQVAVVGVGLVGSLMAVAAFDASHPTASSKAAASNTCATCPCLGARGVAAPRCLSKKGEAHLLMAAD